VSTIALSLSGQASTALFIDIIFQDFAVTKIISLCKTAQACALTKLNFIHTSI
jgi:hypothetical protein